MLHAKIGADDAARYGHPDWVPLDLAALNDEPLSVLVKYEDQIGPITDVANRYARGSDYAKVAFLWLARVRAGIDTPPFREFDVKPRRIRFDDRPGPGGDAIPPPAGSSEPSPPTE